MPQLFSHCVETNIAPFIHPRHHGEQNLYRVHSPIPLFLKPISLVHDNYLVLRGVKCTQHGTCVPYFPPQSATTYSGQLGL